MLHTANAGSLRHADVMMAKWTETEKRTVGLLYSYCFLTKFLKNVKDFCVLQITVFGLVSNVQCGAKRCKLFLSKHKAQQEYMWCLYFVDFWGHLCKVTVTAKNKKALAQKSLIFFRNFGFQVWCFWEATAQHEAKPTKFQTHPAETSAPQFVWNFSKKN